MRKIAFAALIPTALAVVLAAGLAGTSHAGKAEPTRPDFKTKILPIAKKYCYGCHKMPKPADRIDLTKFKTIEDVLKEPRLWRKSGKTVKSKTMPPADKPQLKPAEAKLFTTWAESLPRE